MSKGVTGSLSLGCHGMSFSVKRGYVFGCLLVYVDTAISKPTMFVQILLNTKKVRNVSVESDHY